MSVHVVRSAAAFLAILIAYWMYALLAVPLIEPRINERPGSVGGIGKNSRQSWREQQFKKIFPPGSWELERRKVIETAQGDLLFKDYHPQDDGQVRIEPCTLVFYTSSSGADKRGRPIVMRAPDALLRFDRPLDLARAEIGRLTEAWLMGEVKIDSAETEPGKGDDLAITTHDVHLTQDQITTPRAVDFRFGRSFGKGRDLKIVLTPSEPSNTDRGPMFDGVRSLELFHIDRVRMYVAAKGLFSGQPNPAAAGEASLPSSAGPGVKSVAQEPVAQEPVDITCSGPYRFDFLKNVASFEKDVQVLHEVSGAESDRLTADQLDIHFTPRDPDSQAVADAEAGTSDGREKAEKAAHAEERSVPLAGLNVQRLVATGQPAVLRSPSRGVVARGEHLEYDLSTGQIYLEDPRKVMLRGPQQYMEALKLRYELAAEGRIGRVWADGPGRFEGLLQQEGASPGGMPPAHPRQNPAAPPAAAKQPIKAAWRKRLRLLPHDGLHVLSLVEGASVEMSGSGGFKAEEIHVWLREIEHRGGAQGPDGKPKTEVVADRMLALRDVEIDSTRLTGDTQRLEAWFRYEAPAEQDAAGRTTFVRPPPDGPPTRRPPSSPWPPTAQGNAFATRQAPQVAPSPAAPARRFELHGKLVQVQLVQRGKQDPEAETVVIEGEAHLRELPGAVPAQPPLDLRGDKLHMTGGDSPRAKVNVFGRPAQAAARGLSMRGSNIHLDRGANRLWIDGPGNMTLPPRAAAAGTSPGAPVHVAWQERMEFDGSTVHFERDVRTRMRQFEDTGGWTDTTTYGDVLDATVSRFVNFAAEKQADDVELRRLVYDGGVFVESRGYNRYRAQQSWDRMQMPELAVDQLTGELSSRGSGWIRSVRRGSAAPLAQPGSGPPFQPPGRAPGRPSQPPPPSAEQTLTFTRIDYRDGITGNIHRREVVFHDQVQTLYGPVPDWNAEIDADSREGLGEKGVVIHCDQLAVYEMGPWVTRNRRAVELLATGDAVVEGKTFNAEAERLKYAEAKDLVILEGDGRRDAELWRQQQIGGPRSHAAAQKILYWRTENRIEGDNVKFADLSQLGSH